MEGILFTAGWTAVMVVVAVAVRQDYKKRVAWFRDAADELGLSVTTRFLGHGVKMEGHVGPVYVRLEEKHKGKHDRFITLRAISSRIPRELGLHREKGGGWLDRFRAPEEDHLVGDARFDAEVVVQGPVREALARLGAETRALWRTELARLDSTLRDRRLDRKLPYRSPASTLIREARTAVEMLRGLELEVDLPAALARNAAEDPFPGVRFRNLEVLQDDFPGRPESEVASRAALEDEDPAVRVRGAALLGEEGIPVLRSLAVPSTSSEEERREAARHGLHVTGVPAPVQVAALRRLLHLLEPADLEPILTEQLERGSGKPRRLAVQAVGSLGLAGCVPQLRALAAGADEETATALADAFGRIGHEGAEEDLTPLLNHPARPVRHRAARGLGLCGTVTAVPALRAVAGRHPLDRELTRIVEDAVTAIQSRVEGAEAGQLTLAEAEGERGSLSLADEDGAGELAIVDERGEPG